jgi:hypothetical protein
MGSAALGGKTVDEWATHFLTPTLGVGGLLVLAVLMLLRGDIIPRKQVDAELRQKNDAIALWKDAYERSEAQHVKKDALIAGLMETAQATRSVLHALPEAAGLNEGSTRVPPTSQ